MRSNTIGLHELLRRLLAAHLVEGLEAPANYSLRLAAADRAGRGQGGFHFLYQGSTSVVRTSDPRRLIYGLVSHISSHLSAAFERYLHLDALALVAHGRAVLAPSGLRLFMTTIERHLQSRGLAVVDAPWTSIDPRTGEVVVLAPTLEPDLVVLEELDDLVDSRFRRPDPPVPVGRYPLAGWAFGLGPDTTGALSRAQGVLRARTFLINPDAFGAQEALDGLANALRAATPVAILWERASDLAASLAGLVS